MKTLPLGMTTTLQQGATTHCICWKLTREDGEVMGFTDHDMDVVFDGRTYKAATGVNGSNIKSSTGLSVDDTEAMGALVSDSITEEDISKKLYDNAAISIYRVDWSDVTKRVVIFSGFLGQVVRGRLDFKAEVRSLSQALNQPIGQLYQKTCNVDLFSPKCGVDIDSDPTFKVAGVVSTVYSRRLCATTTADVIALPNGWFTGGKIIWTSGDNVGVVVEVKSHVLQTGDTEAWVDMWEAMPALIQVGDEFEIRVGCDKLVETCKAKFDNVANFRGFPRMPGQDAMVAVVSKKDRNDGTSWYT